MLTAIRITKGVTLNMGNYESLRLDIALETSLTPGAVIGEAQRELSENADAVLRAEVKRAKEHWPSYRSS